MELSNSQSFFKEKEEMQIIVCPYCFIRIPFIALGKSEENFVLTINCACLSEAKQIPLRALFVAIEPFIHRRTSCINLHQCKDCSFECFDIITDDHDLKRYIDFLQELQQNVQCSQHKQPFAFYSTKSQQHFCLKCEQLHHVSKESLSIALKPIDLSLIDYNYNLIEMIMTDKRALINQFNSHIEKDMNECKLTQSSYEMLKKEAAFALQAYEESNGLLKWLYRCLYFTQSFLRKNPCYQLQSLVNTLKVNSKPFIDRDSSNSEQSFRNLANYLLAEPVLIQREPYTCIATLSQHTLPVWSLKLMNENQLASASYDTTVKLWDLSSFKCTSTLNGHSNAIFCLMNCDNNHLISCSGDRTIKIWNTSMSKCNTTLTGYTDWIYCLIKLNDNQLVSGAYDGTINIWNLKTFQCVKKIKAHLESVTCLVELSNGRFASGSKDCSIKLWSPEKAECLYVIEAHSHSVCCIEVLEDESLASSGVEPLIKIWHADGYKLKITLNQHRSTVWCLLPLSNHRLASSSDDRTIKIWSIVEYNCITTLKGHVGGICSLILLNENQIASGSRDNSIKIWNV